MTKDEALRLALEFIPSINPAFICEASHHKKLEQHASNEPCPHVAKQKQVYEAIKAALEAKDEPVAWLRTSGTGSPVVTEALLIEMPEMRWNFQQPLYTTPPQRTWVGLTHAEIDYQAKKDDHGVYFALGALWAEAKLRSKNT